MNVGSIFSLLGHFAPAAAGVYAGHMQGEMQADNDYAQAQQEKQERERQERIDSQMETIRSLQIEEAQRKAAETPERPDAWIDVGGRKFPNTPEGERAAAEWDRQINPSKYREPQGPVSPEIGYGTRDWDEYLRRFSQIEGMKPDEPELDIDNAIEIVREQHPELRGQDLVDAAERLRRGQPIVPELGPGAVPVGGSTFRAEPVKARGPNRAPGGRAAEFAEARRIAMQYPAAQRQAVLEEAGYNATEISVILH